MQRIFGAGYEKTVREFLKECEYSYAVYVQRTTPAVTVYESRKLFTSESSAKQYAEKQKYASVLFPELFTVRATVLKVRI